MVAPKTLLGQWQDELWALLDLPSAVWTGHGWEDEQGMFYPAVGIEGLRRCPRRLGLVSGGLITQAGLAAEILTSLRYECVIVDEAHRARRRNLGPTHRKEKADPNNLLRFVRTIAPNTKSLLLATATPVQLDPIEAWDLLDALNLGNETVLGSPFSSWERHPRLGLDYVLGREAPPTELDAAWEWVRDPLPPAGEGLDYALLRKPLGLSVGAELGQAGGAGDAAPARTPAPGPRGARLLPGPQSVHPPHRAPHPRLSGEQHRPADQRAILAAGPGAPLWRRGTRRGDARRLPGRRLQSRRGVLRGGWQAAGHAIRAS